VTSLKITGNQSHFTIVRSPVDIHQVNDPTEPSYEDVLPRKGWTKLFSFWESSLVPHCQIKIFSATVPQSVPAELRDFLRIEHPVDDLEAPFRCADHTLPSTASTGPHAIQSDPCFRQTFWKCCGFLLVYDTLHQRANASHDELALRA
jgi:hypothetical protein